MIDRGKILFITATDTGVGKTYVAALLVRYLLDRGIQAGYQKWVGTGDGDASADLLLIREWAGEQAVAGGLDAHAPYRFSLPASPHLAAELESRSIDTDTITARLEALAERHEFLVVEGVGGVLVPLRRDLLLADFLAGRGLRVLVVARSGLGTLNHTLLTLEALRKRRIDVLGVIFSDSPAHDDPRIIEDNMKTVAETGRVRVFGRLPRAGGLPEAEETFRPIGEALMAGLF